MNAKLLGLAAAAALTGMMGAASAAIVITAPQNHLIADNYGTGNGLGLQTTIGYLPSNNPSIASVFFTNNGNTPVGGVYSGSVNNVAKTPFGSGNANFLVAQPNGAVVIVFKAPQTSFSLLWGTVDTYNGITFITNANQQVTGTDVYNADHSIVYGTTNEPVTISGLDSFTTLTVFSSGIAFEFDTATVPEPITMALLGTGLVGLGLVRRRRSA